MSERYDVNATEEDVQRGSQYVSKRDFRAAGVLVVLLAAGFYPIYQYGKAQSQRVQCSNNNLRLIAQAIATYSEQHDSGYPPLFRADSQGQPLLGESGLAYTWISDIATGIAADATLVCPTAQPNEIAYQEDPSSTGKRIPSTYGMYAPYGATKTYDVDNPESTILVAETADHGAARTFDPHPLAGPHDGFVLGYNTPGLLPVVKKSTLISRLAFPGTANGEFDPDGEGRHPGGSYFLTAQGGRQRLGPGIARLALDGRGYPRDPWEVPVRAER